MTSDLILKQRLSNYFSTTLCDYDNPKSLGSWFRRRRARCITELLKQCYERYDRVDILDIGGRENYWSIIPAEYFSKYNLSVTLVNDDDELEAGRSNNTKTRFFTEVKGNGCDLAEFADNSFHFVHCNSVIEHVGCWDNMQAMAKEITRLAPSYYVQTPNFWFPIEPHFLTLFYHWLPEPVRVSLLLNFSLGHMNKQLSISDAVKVVQGVQLIDKKMLQALFPEASIKSERFLLMDKSISAVKTLD